MKNNLQGFTVVLLVIVSVGLCCIPTEGLGQTPAKVLKVMIDPGHGGEDMVRTLVARAPVGSLKRT